MMSLFDVLGRIFRRAREDGHEHDSGPGAGSCEEAMRLVQEFLDGELEDVSAARVRRHFEICQRCYPRLRLEEAFRAALHKVAEGEGASPELRERVLRVLQEARADR